jgi:hypothetical protein
VVLEGRRFALAVDGKVMAATEKLPALSGGDSYILVWPARGEERGGREGSPSRGQGRGEGGRFQLRDLRYIVRDETAGKLAGILVDRGDGWMDVKADGEAFVRRYVPLEDARGRPEPKLVGAISRTFVPNRIELAWRLHAGRRRLLGFEMKCPNQGESGVATGTVTDIGRTWIEVRPDDAPPDRYTPRWIGGMPSDGGGLEKEMLRQFAGLRVGDRVRVRWTYEHRRRALAVEVLP